MEEPVMKKSISLLLALLIALVCIPAEGSDLNEEELLLSLTVTFDKNLVFSTYDVLLYLDDELIASIPHGKKYSESLLVQKGPHVLMFRKNGDDSVDESYLFTIQHHMTLSCNIQAKHDQVLISSLSTDYIDETNLGILLNKPAEITHDRVIEINGDLHLNLMARFKKNNLMSTYNVKVFCDEIQLAELANGEDYNVVLGVSPGIHVISFQNADDPNIKGISQFNLSSNTTYACEIESHFNEVMIKNERINNNRLEKNDFIAACLALPYEDAIRFPEKNAQLHVMIAGKVIESFRESNHMDCLLLQDQDGNMWEIDYVRSEEDARIIEGDYITVYGLFMNVITHTLSTGDTITVPQVLVLYLA